MDQQNGLFGFLENHVMGPMGKLAQFKVVRAITAAGMAAALPGVVASQTVIPVIGVPQCSWYLVFCHKPSHSGQL